MPEPHRYGTVEDLTKTDVDAVNAAWDDVTLMAWIKCDDDMFGGSTDKKYHILVYMEQVKQLIQFKIYWK